jgi:hypothetical protein
MKTLCTVLALLVSMTAAAERAFLLANEFGKCYRCSDLEQG